MRALPAPAGLPGGFPPGLAKAAGCGRKWWNGIGGGESPGGHLDREPCEGEREAKHGEHEEVPPRDPDRVGYEAVDRLAEGVSGPPAPKNEGDDGGGKGIAGHSGEKERDPNGAKLAMPTCARRHHGDDEGDQHGQDQQDDAGA